MKNIQNFKRDRPTIGVLIGLSIVDGIMLDHYVASLIRGIQSAARSRNCHLLISWGIRPITDVNPLLHSAWPVVSPESDFVPVGPWNTDGLIIVNPLANENQSLYLQQLMANGFPVLFIGSGEKGPEISVNNHAGIYQAIGHLVEHGHRRIAFIAGLPVDKGDTISRLDAYHSAVTEYNLHVDPRLVVWGWYAITPAYNAVRDLLQSGDKFTAVVASNDNSAIGAMQAIQEFGLKIPQDIAIIGFDDHPGAIAQVPPLSSVHVPLNLIGEQALLLMLDHLTGQSPLESIHIQTRLIKRQSCGCTPNVVTSEVVRISSKKPAIVYHSTRPDIQTIQQQVISEMLSALTSEVQFSAREQIQQACTVLVESFCASLTQDNHKEFETSFIEAVRKLEMADVSIGYLQEMISILRSEMIRLPVQWDQSKTRQLADDMLYLAYVIIGESTQRWGLRQEYQWVKDTQELNLVTARLSTALNNYEVVELLNTYLPGIGIKHARLMFFEAEQADSVAWSIVPGPLQDGSLNKRFRSREFPPPDLYPHDELLNVILLPLDFQSGVLGCVAFDAGEIRSCAAITKQLVATIKVSRLHAQVVELSLTDPLTGLHNRRYFDIFLTNEIARGHRFSSHELSIVMVDIDHFKDYNDQFGHPAGDQALRQVADCLTNGRRPTDVVSRLGGEEFAIILPETNINGALICAEKLRASVAAISNLNCPITISLGIAVLTEDIYKPEILLQHADQALYEAKNTGRNRICIYNEKVADG